VQGGGFKGFENAGIDLFRGQRLDRMVRECIQNSLDAKDPDVEGSVIVAMTLGEVNPQDDTLLHGLDYFLSLGAVQSSAGSDERAWYQDAKKTIKKPTVSVLGIHDANTIGLKGASKLGPNVESRWLALVTGQGMNLGQGVDQLGGFGHGSNAAFAMSRLRTAFYLSSSHDEFDAPITRFQGHSLLQTLFEQGNEQTTPDGFYGETTNFESEPLVGEAIPSVFTTSRAHVVGTGLGTSVFVCDPYVEDHEKAWDEILISVVANFGFAIRAGNLEVRLRGDFLIDHESLEEALERAWEIKASSSGRGLEISEATWENLEATKTMLFSDYSSGETPLAIEGFGQVHWFLRLGADVQGRSVAVAREPGMIITRRAPNLLQFNGYRDFDLLVCVRSGTTGRSGAHVIKKMEDPAHKELDFQWVPDSYRTDYKSRYGKFRRAVVEEILKQYAQQSDGEEIDINIDGLLMPTFQGEKSEREGMSKVTITVGGRARRTPRWSPPKHGPGFGDGGPDGEGPGGGNPGPDSPGGPVPPRPGGPFVVEGVTYDKTPLGKLQIVPTGNVVGEYSEIRVVIQKLQSGNSRLELFVSGESQTDEIEIRQEPSTPVPRQAIDKKPNVIAPGVPLAKSAKGRQELQVWIPTAKLRLAFGARLYAELSKKAGG
jgi:hypothetical protein